MTPLRILQVIPSVAAVRGGPSAAIAEIERALTDLGHEVTTLTTDDDGDGRRASRPESARENGALRRYFPKQTNFYTVSRPLVAWAAAHARDFDLMHAHALFSHTSVFAARAARAQGLPFVMRPYGTLMRYGREQKPLMKAVSIRLFEGPLLEAANAVHFTSEAERVEAEETGLRLRGAVIPLGVAPPGPGDRAGFRRRHAIPAEAVLILFLSRIHQKKNLEALIDALARLAPSQPALRLAICGEGAEDYVAGLRARAAAQGVADRIAWAGFVEGQAKADAFAAADLFALPSHSENFGIAAVEALLAGLPSVIGEGVAVAREIAAEGAGIAVAPEGEAVAAGILQALAGDRDRQAAAARRLAEDRFGRAAMGRSLDALYRRILASR